MADSFHLSAGPAGLAFKWLDTQKEDCDMRARLKGASALTGIVLIVAMTLVVACSSAEEPKAPQQPQSAAPAAPAAPVQQQAAVQQQPQAAAPAQPAAPAEQAAMVATAVPLPTRIARPAPTPVPAGLIKRGGTMKIGTAQPVQFLDPHRGGLANNRNAFVGMFNSLTDWDFTGLAQSELAESWDFDASALIWTINLQKNVKFHNGRDFTAQDVKNSLDRIFDPERRSFIVQRISEIQGSEVVDDHTIKFNLSKSSGALLPGLIDARVVAQENIDADNFNEAPIGTGPFKFDSYIVNDRMKMVKFDDYWEVGADDQALPYMDGVTVLTIADSTAVYTALLTGIVDAYWQMTPKFVVNLDENDMTKPRAVRSTFSTNYTSFFFEMDKGIFQDARVREGFVRAMDRQGIVDAGYEGLAQPNWSNANFPPGGPFTNPDVQELPQDTELAKKLFAEAGVTQIRGLFTSENAEFRPMSLVFQQSLKEAGVEMIIELIPLETWFGYISSFRAKPWRDDDSFAPNIRFLPPEPTNALTGWECGNHFASGWCSEEMDKWSHAGREAVDFEERKDAYYKYQEVYQGLYPAFNCCWRPNWHGESRQLNGLRDLFGNFKYTEAWLDK
jgi:peptide/nickel transport system substrate-binding protein